MRGRAIRLLATVLVAGTVVGGCVGSAQARATRPSRGLFSISPGLTELFGAPGLVLSPTAVGNSTGVPLFVRVTPVLVHETRSGTFAYRTTRAARRAARRVLAVSTPGFALGGHARHSVLERWLPSAGHHAAYAGVVYRVKLPVRSRGVRTVDQLLGLDLLGIRGSRPPRGRLTRVSVADGSQHRVSFTVSLRNAGGSFGTPTGVGLTVRAPGGRIVTRVAMTPGVILPGVVRDFVAELPARLARGRYTAVASATLDGRVRPRSLRFRVAANGELPAPSLVAGGVRSRGTVGGHAEVTVALRNQGTRPGRPRGTVALYAMHGGAADRRPEARSALTGAAIAPGRAAREHLAFGRLHAGAYQTVVRYATPFVPTSPVYIDFVPRRSATVSGVIASWVDGHLAVILMGLALVLVVGYSTRRVRRATGAAGNHAEPVPTRPQP